MCMTNYNCQIRPFFDKLILSVLSLSSLVFLQIMTHVWATRVSTMECVRLSTATLCANVERDIGDGGTEKSHPCKLGLWPLFRCWVLCWMCGRACHCIHLAHLHEWDFSIPPLPRYSGTTCATGIPYSWFYFSILDKLMLSYNEQNFIGKLLQNGGFSSSCLTFPTQNENWYFSDHHCGRCFYNVFVGVVVFLFVCVFVYFCFIFV